MTPIAKRVMKKAALAVLGSAPVLGNKLKRIADAGALTILNFHRVDDTHATAYEALSPYLFEDLVIWLKRHFRLVLFRDLADLAVSGKPPMILSFDDGYMDFVETVVPILERHGVAANQNIVAACVETGLPPANVLVQDFIRQAPANLLQEIRFPGLARGADPERRQSSGERVSAALKNRPIVEQRAILATLMPHFERFDGFRPTRVMSAADIRTVMGVHEIGAHSFEHATMTVESDAYLSEDLKQCRVWFAQRLDISPTIYAFPNGAARPEHAEAASGRGFRHVLWVGERFSRVGGSCHTRFTMHADSFAETRFRALGGFVTPDGA